MNLIKQFDKTAKELKDIITKMVIQLANEKASNEDEFYEELDNLSYLSLEEICDMYEIFYKKDICKIAIVKEYEEWIND